MRARIIFRGLTLFKFSKGTETAKDGDNMGELTAWLISDPKMGNAAHHHEPNLAISGATRTRGLDERRRSASFPPK